MKKADKNKENVPSLSKYADGEENFPLKFL